jgi:hypothetical protein
MRSSASTRDRLGACRSRATAKPNPPRPLGPSPAWAPIYLAAIERDLLKIRKEKLPIRLL